MKTKDFFELEIWVKQPKDSQYNGCVKLDFESIPTKMLALAALEDHFLQLETERKWTTKTYHLEFLDKEDGSIQYDRNLRRKTMAALQKYELPKLPESWEHIGRITSVPRREIRISLTKKSVYCVPKKTS